MSAHCACPSRSVHLPFLSQGPHADPHDYFGYTETALRLMLEDFRDVRVLPHGNGLGVSWRRCFGRWRALAPLNPLMRQLSRSTNPTYAEGYAFRAVRPG